MLPEDQLPSTKLVGVITRMNYVTMFFRRCENCGIEPTVPTDFVIGLAEIIDDGVWMEKCGKRSSRDVGKGYVHARMACG